jgi:hypothetical protein
MTCTDWRDVVLLLLIGSQLPMIWRRLKQWHDEL